MTAMQQQLDQATVMHGQVSQLVLQGILKPDALGNLSLNAEDEHFEDAIGDLIKASKSKHSLAKPKNQSALVDSGGGSNESGEGSADMKD